MSNHSAALGYDACDDAMSRLDQLIENTQEARSRRTQVVSSRGVAGLSPTAASPVTTAPTTPQLDAENPKDVARFLDALPEQLAVFPLEQHELSPDKVAKLLDLL